MPQNPFQHFNIGTDNNPLLSSMESLRQAWASMPNNPLASMTPLQMQSTEELEKRITELQAVENWLSLNLSMLRNTIQALEIQRSTLSAFQAFSQMQWPSGAMGAAASSADDEDRASAQSDSSTSSGATAQSDEADPAAAQDASAASAKEAASSEDTEIGRASCRERVARSGPQGAGKRYV